MVKDAPDGVLENTTHNWIIFAWPRGTDWQTDDSPVSSWHCNAPLEKASVPLARGSSIFYSFHQVCNQKYLTVGISWANTANIKPQMQGVPNPASRVPTSACPSQDAPGMLDMSSPSSAPIPVIKAPRPRPHPKCRREVLVDGRDKCAQVLGVVQAAAGIFQVGLRAEFKWVDCAVVDEAQLGGSICFLCISFSGLGLYQLSIFVPWAHAEILFGKINIIFLDSPVERAVYTSACRKKQHVRSLHVHDSARI